VYSSLPPSDHGPPPSDIELLRSICERQGVFPEDADLEAVRGFLDAILPVLAELERGLPEGIDPPS
jgi:hypothetical protein